MNEAHIHLIINHFPIVSLILGLLVLVAGYIAKNIAVKTTALALFIFAALTTMFTFYTGEGAEDVLENTTNVSHQLIHEHEEYGEVLYTINIILGILAMVTLWFQARKAVFVKYAYLVIFLLATAAAVVAGLTANTGGEIRHTEIRTIK